MLFLVASLLLLGIIAGAAAHLPPDVSLVSGAAIAVCLLGFAVRERRRAGR